jgi:hypothetical protein
VGQHGLNFCIDSINCHNILVGRLEEFNAPAIWDKNLVVTREDGPSRGFKVGQFGGRQLVSGRSHLGGNKVLLLGIWCRPGALRAAGSGTFGFTLLERIFLCAFLTGHGLLGFVWRHYLNLLYWLDVGVQGRRDGRAVVVLEGAFLRN